MPTIECFEDLEIWQKARTLSVKIHRTTKLVAFAEDFDLKKQARRSSGSIMDNIAEGFERGGKGEFIQFLSIAKGSCGELRSQLYRATDYNYISEENSQLLIAECKVLSKMIMGFIKYLRKSEIKGVKYKMPGE